MGAEVAHMGSPAPSSALGFGSDTPGPFASSASSSSSAAADGGYRQPLHGPAGPPRSRSIKAEKFKRVLSAPAVDLAALRELLWSGAPEEDDPAARASAWQMLLGYLPPVRERQEQGVLKKRGEYEELRKRHYRFQDGAPEAGDCDEAAGLAQLRQIRVDIPRTCASLPLFSHPRMHRLMERVLYIWSVRHPASGYVQGINDLVTPFVVVFLSAGLPPGSPALEELDLGTVDEAVLDAAEAGAYWCISKVLSEIQDHYTARQPGIQKMITKLKEIVHRIDGKLYRHLEEQGLDFLQFSFRWMNCLLLREFPLTCVIRLWDTYIAEPSEGFSTFHVYVCAVFLIYWSPQLKQMDFQQLMLFMQKLPTTKWRTQEIETLLAEAFVLKSLFHASPKHLE